MLVHSRFQDFEILYPCLLLGRRILYLSSFLQSMYTHREICMRNSISRLSLNYSFYQFLYCCGLARIQTHTCVHVSFNLNLANCQHFNQPYQIHTNYLGFHIDIILQLVHHILFGCCFAHAFSSFWAPIFVHPDREKIRRRNETNSEQV